MARTVLSLALLACLGLALIQLVSAEQQEQQEIEATSNEAVQAKPEEVQRRIVRVADAKKKGNGNRRPSSKGKGTRRTQKKGKGNKGPSGKGKGTRRTLKKGKGNKGPSRKGKGTRRTQKKGKGNKGPSRKGKGTRRTQKKGKGNKRPLKKGRKGTRRTTKGKGTRRTKKGNGKKSQSKKGKETRRKTGGKVKGKGSKTSANSNFGPRQAACDVEGLCQQIKNYIKFSNQLRKLKRITRTCSTMEKKRDKASGGEFSAAAASNADSGNDTVNAIAAELANCTASAKENCEITGIEGCTNTTLSDKCKAELEAWIAAWTACLKAGADCCACITGITPAPAADCLTFEAKDIASKAKKKLCTGSGTKGSFGYCRTLQQTAAEEGPKAHKEKCKGATLASITTAAPARRMVLRNILNKKWIKS